MNVHRPIMPDLLHILNGDALAEHFPTALPGERLVFRECLVDGPLRADTPEQLCRMRGRWMEQAYGIPTAEHTALSRPCYRDLESVGADRSVVLWFEDDLFCQVNAWYVVHRLRHLGLRSLRWVRPTASLSFGFGGMDKSELERAYQIALLLHAKDLDGLSAAWWMFRSGRSSALPVLADAYSERMPWLPQAAAAAVNLLEDRVGGPRRLVQRLVDQLGTDAGFGPVFRAFAEKAPEYGLGDLQVLRYWKAAGGH